MAPDFPTPDMELTHILVVGDLGRARTFYTDVLGAEVYREYGGTSLVLRFLGTWLLLVTGGGPTADKPDVIFAGAARPQDGQPCDDHPCAELRGRLCDAAGAGRRVSHPASGVAVGGALLLP